MCLCVFMRACSKQHKAPDRTRTCHSHNTPFTIASKSAIYINSFHPIVRVGFAGIYIRYVYILHTGLRSFSIVIFGIQKPFAIASLTFTCTTQSNNNSQNKTTPKKKNENVSSNPFAPHHHRQNKWQLLLQRFNQRMIANEMVFYFLIHCCSRTGYGFLLLPLPLS